MQNAKPPASTTTDPSTGNSHLVTQTEQFKTAMSIGTYPGPKSDKQTPLLEIEAAQVTSHRPTNQSVQIPGQGFKRNDRLRAGNIGNLERNRISQNLRNLQQL